MSNKLNYVISFIHFVVMQPCYSAIQVLRVFILLIIFTQAFILSVYAMDSTASQLSSREHNQTIFRLNELASVVRKASQPNSPTLSPRNSSPVTSPRAAQSPALSHQARAQSPTRPTRESLSSPRRARRFCLDAFQYSRPQSKGALFSAIEENNQIDVEKIIDQNFSALEEKDELDTTPLLYAATLKKAEIARLLIDKNAFIGATDKNINNLFLRALSIEDRAARESAHDATVGKSATDAASLGGTDLVDATACERHKGAACSVGLDLKDCAVRENGATSDSANDAAFVKNIIGYIKAKKRNHAHILSRLINDKNVRGYNAFMVAAAKGYVDLVKEFLPFVTDINVQTIDGYSALLLAVISKQDLMVDTLIKSGIDFRAKTLAGETPLEIAQNIVRTSPEHNTVFELLNVHCENILSKLIYAIKNNDVIDVRKILNITTSETASVALAPAPSLSTNAINYEEHAWKPSIVALVPAPSLFPNPVNRYDEYGWTPFHYAVYGGNEEIIKILINHHAYVQIKTVAREGFVINSGLKEEHRAALEQPGKTPLMIAAYLGRARIADFIIAAAERQDYDLSELILVRDGTGKTACEYAIEFDSRAFADERERRRIQREKIYIAEKLLPISWQDEQRLFYLAAQAAHYPLLLRLVQGGYRINVLNQLKSDQNIHPTTYALIECLAQKQLIEYVIFPFHNEFFRRFCEEHSFRSTATKSEVNGFSKRPPRKQPVNTPIENGRSVQDLFKDFCKGHTFETADNGQNVFIWSCILGNYDLVESFLANDHMTMAICTKKDRWGFSALDYAQLFNHERIIDLLNDFMRRNAQ